MRRRVVVAEPAQRHIREVDRWWRKNRLAAPDLFAQELGAAFETISTHPGAGRRYAHPVQHGVRRTLLRACRYHVYYVATDDEIVVLAVWNAVRGSGPPLAGLL